MLNLPLKTDKTTRANSLKITQAELERLNRLKELDIQICSFCKKTNLLNLGWTPFTKLHCQACQEVHVLCPELCIPIARNILGCDLYVEYKPVGREEVKPNRPYDRAKCYLCGKELKGAGKTGKIKNRNNPSFWGVKSEWKIMCLGCVGKKYYPSMSKGKQKTFKKYVGRGYV